MGLLGSRRRARRSSPSESALNPALNPQSHPTRAQPKLNPLQAHLQLITGKGGVGRTTTAIALSHALAARGERTLLLEVRDAESELGDGATYHARSDSMLGRALTHSRDTSAPHREHDAIRALGPEPTRISDNLWAAQLVASVGHEEFLSTVIPSGRLVRAALESKALARFLRSAPSMHELGIYYHLSRLADDERFERVVVDLPASGHTLALTELPERMARLLKRGRIVDALRSGVAALSDPQHCALWIVTLNEELPLTESLELEEALRADGVTPSGVIVNRVLPRALTAEERDVLRELLARARSSDTELKLDTKLDTELDEVIKVALRDRTWTEQLTSFATQLTLPETMSHSARVAHIKTLWFAESAE